jgi:hypothetical protein
VYAYVWDDSGKEYSESSPGTLLTTQSGGFYSYEAQSPEYGYVHVRFNDGTDQSTLDILGVDKNTYYQSSGTYSGDSSKVLVRSSTTSSISVPKFKATEITDSTVTLAWDPIPGIDVYILYDEFIEFDDNDEEIPNSEYWHFQKALMPSEVSLYDDNYGQYLDPESVYTWKLKAIKYKDNADLSSLDALDPDDISEEDYSPYYTVVYDFGELEVETKESSLPAPTGLRVTNTGPTSVEVAWNEVPGADYYMVWWWNDGSDGREQNWYYIEAAYDNKYLDGDEEFIFPNSTYKYYVVAHNERTYSKDSNEVSAQTPAASQSYTGTILDIARAAAAKPAAPSYISATPNLVAAKQMVVSWPIVPGALKYEVWLTKTSTATTSVKKQIVSGSNQYTFTSIPTTQSAYYVKVRAINNNGKWSDWTTTSSPIPVFPEISVKKATSKVSGAYKNVTVTMNASWKSGVSYGYNVTFRDPLGNTYSANSTTNTITQSLPKGPKYTAYITPYTGSYTQNRMIPKEIP